MRLRAPIVPCPTVMKRRARSRRFVRAVSAALVCCSGFVSVAHADVPRRSAPQEAPSDRPEIVPGEYIVVINRSLSLHDMFNVGMWSNVQLGGLLKPAATPSPNFNKSMTFGPGDIDLAKATTLVREWVDSKSGEVKLVFAQGFTAFSAKLLDWQVAVLSAIHGIELFPNVYIRLPRPEPTDAVTLIDDVLDEGPWSIQGKVGGGVVAIVGPRAPRGLDRIDQRMGRDGNRSQGPNGAGVHVYVIDSGIRAKLDEFRASDGGTGWRVLAEHGDGKGYVAKDLTGGTDDCYGHGTKVAAIIGGKDHGVASGVTLHPVRVFDCNGVTTAAVVIDAVRWVTAQHKAHPKFRMVVNMSLGSVDGEVHLSSQDRTALALLDKSVSESIGEGVTYVIAAGNNSTAAASASACDFSPAQVDSAITVGSIDPDDDTRAVSSNEDSCVDLFAPGVRIRTVNIYGAPEIPSGTSFAAPHVTGVIALYLQNKNASAVPIDVRTAIMTAASKYALRKQEGYENWCGVRNIKLSTPNILLHWGSGSTDGIKDDPAIVPMANTLQICP